MFSFNIYLSSQERTNPTVEESVQRTLNVLPYYKCI